MNKLNLAIYGNMDKSQKYNTNKRELQTFVQYNIYSPKTSKNIIKTTYGNVCFTEQWKIVYTYLTV